MKRITITGANSFIGSYLKDNAKEFEVEEIDLISTKPNSINFKNTDVVFHVAAIVHQDKTISDETYFKVNSDLAFAVAKKAKQDGVKQFVFMSTVKVYGENSTYEDAWVESSGCFPSDAYGKSKLQAEKLLTNLEEENFAVAIIRTPVVYGEGVKGNIKKIAKFVKNNKIIPFKGIDNKRAMVYIGNLVALIKEVIKEQESGVFLAGDGVLLSTSELVKNLIEANDEKKYFIIFPKMFQSIIKLFKPNLYKRLFGSMVIDNSETFKKLNFQPPYTPQKGINEIMKSL